MNISTNEILNLFDKSVKVIDDSKELVDEIKKIAEEIIHCIRNGNKIILFGNGGSAADSQHMAAEFIGRYILERKSFPAISLTTDSSILTAIGNDYGFEQVFSRQCESLVQKNDIIVAISTSGKSKNVIKGLQICKEKGAKIVGMTGKNPNEIQNYADFLIAIPSDSTPNIQEGHRVIIHIICELVEKNI